MKVRVKVPTEPVCNITLEIEEAKALLVHLTGDRAIECHMDANILANDFVMALYKNLGITPEGPLFQDIEAEAKIIDADAEPPKKLEKRDWPF